MNDLFDESFDTNLTSFCTKVYSLYEPSPITFYNTNYADFCPICMKHLNKFLFSKKGSLQNCTTRRVSGTEQAPGAQSTIFGSDITNHPSSMLDKRWVSTDGWCNLCNVPFKSWGDHLMPTHHIGHRQLEMYHDTMVRCEFRTWSPREVLYGTLSRLYKNPSNSTGSDMTAIHAIVDADNANHKQRINQCLKHLANYGIFDGLFINGRHQGNPSIIKGSNLVPGAAMKHLLTMFPGYDTGYLSDIVQLICSHDNSFDVFMLLGGEELLKNFEVGEKFWKADLFRAILGELYHITIRRSRSLKIGEDIRAIAQFTLQACIAELVLKILEEIAARVDTVWRRLYNMPFINESLPAKIPLNRSAKFSTITQNSAKFDLDNLQTNRFKHESWFQQQHRVVGPTKPSTSKNRSFAPLNPHSNNTFRPRFGQFFKNEDRSVKVIEKELL